MGNCLWRGILSADWAVFFWFRWIFLAFFRLFFFFGLGGYTPVYRYQYDILLRSDLDAFMAPNWGNWTPLRRDVMYVGKGGFINGGEKQNLQTVRRLLHAARRMGLPDPKVVNPGTHIPYLGPHDLPWVPLPLLLVPMPLPFVPITLLTLVRYFSRNGPSGY